jgi:hypothetical protein
MEVNLVACLFNNKPSGGCKVSAEFEDGGVFGVHFH